MSFELRVAGLSKTYANGVRALDKVSLLRVENQGYIHYRKGSLVYVRPARVCTPCAMPWARRRSTARSSRSRWGPYGRDRVVRDGILFPVFVFPVYYV